ncbi:hypothetical protein MKW98_006476 [Papaver atlanticum]|uniref:Cellulose synthase RING-type zinc finger domain-containing protein n=1 Tax=Papaver atlanticum TaxID=357466 RepID=A0AAD4SIM7_9MAGN|nr:hypothetical protein MKW98_006476 [Papaver atlanticum]
MLVEWAYISKCDDIGKVKSVKELSGQVCEICRDQVEITEEGDFMFVEIAKNERREGSQSCPQCKTRYNRIRGSPRVEGDEGEDLDKELG